TGVPLASRCPEGDDWADYSPGTFAVTVPFDAFTAGPRGRGSWRVLVRVEVAGHVVTAPITRLVRRGALGNPAAVWLPDGDRLLVQWRNRQPLVLDRHRTQAVAGELELAGRTLSGRLTGPGAGSATAVAAGLEIPVRTDAEGRFQVTLPISPDHAEWRLVSAADHGVEVVSRDPVRLVAPGRPTLEVTTDRQGGVVAIDRPPSVLLRSARVLPGSRVALEGEVFDRSATSVTISTTSPKVRAREVVAPTRDGQFMAELDLAYDAFRFGSVPLPSGEHELTVRLDTGETLAVVLGHELQDQLPQRVETGIHEVILGRGPGGGLLIALPPPHSGQAKRYAVGSATRAATSRAPGTATKRGILFRSYFGEKATDNGVAIQAELAKRGSDLPVYWAVQDRSVIVPDGGTPVLVNSPEWFETLASVTYYVDNMYQPTYHHKPRGQLLVQTFHGYPFKQMGLPHWRNMQFAQDKIDSYARRSAEWDYLLSPASYATPLLTRDFGYDGAVLELGYPRNDILQSAEAPALRAQTRASLGIREDQLVVLYAPTFRDYLARNDNQAAMSDFFDFDQVGRAFGDDVVVLMRGHAFHARTKQRVGSRGTTIDVTDYPEVSDLYLAADVGVVDYSSLRFDFGVTGKPMIYLVPDLQRYVDTRGWLFDFEPTAPGPMVSTTTELIEELRDLERLKTRWADDYATFRAAYLDLEDGHAAARFVDQVIVPRGDA
ncbi:MAG: CDP-glycerol glycerophosphotransferase family protein, partial [Nocardioides sp.]